MASLIDADILVYRVDSRFPRKQRIARELLLVEFVSAAMKLKPDGEPLLAPAEARREAEDFLDQAADTARSAP